ncbi:hypothetical protein D3C75_1117670 [compost metagenome]
MPVVEGEQAVDDRVLGLGAQALLVVRRGEQLADRRQFVGEGIGAVAPALAQQVAEQGVADDALGERVAVGGFFPLR